MAIRLDPRRLSALKLLAAEAGMRPGELVTAWIEERLDAARAGRPATAGGVVTGAGGVSAAAFGELTARVDELARRLEQLTPVTEPSGTTPDPESRPVKRRGTPRRERAESRAPEGATTPAGRIPLHEEIEAVISERGPLTAAEIATAIAERGRYAAPRSNRPLDAATVNSRVSNPAYRDRFARSDGRIGLANPT